MTRQEQITKAATAKSRGETPYFFDAFIAGAQWADAHPHWISVEDELPKETNMYIVMHYDVAYTMWWYNGVEEWAEIYVDENGYIQSRQMDGVTHWMPLPKMPVLSNSENTGKDEKGGEQ